MRKLNWFIGGVVMLGSGFVWAVAGASEDPGSVDVRVERSEPFRDLPDRIPVVDRIDGRRVGTMAKSEFLENVVNVQGTPENQEPVRPVNVYNDDGALVGQMVPDVGFVSIEE